MNFNFYHFVHSLTFCSLFFICFDSSSQIKIKSNTNLDTYEACKARLFEVDRDVNIGDYFNYLDSVIHNYDTLLSYNLTEHLLVHANKWIIDSLANTDYYRMMAKDSFVYDQTKLIILKKGQNLIIPDSLASTRIISRISKIAIHINIPEYKLRIYQDSLLYSFPIRVGRNEKKYLKMGDRITNLKTRTGEGRIIAHVKNPDYYNPVTGRKYYATKRDDERLTRMPQIPWIETEINGIRHGQLIHPTTNPKTLGKAYSNGCIGTSEAAAWIIYYYAPIGTKLSIQYNLNVRNKNGKTTVLKDIYQ